MNSDRPTPEQRRARSDLDPRFQRIGISAVAAAAQYAGDQRNPRYAPVEPKDDERAASAVT